MSSSTPASEAQKVPLEVLLVEDESDIAGPLAECLNDEGYHVHVATDGKQGLESLSERHYDVMISDIRLPEVDGLSLFDWTRENAPSTAVILMSAYGSVSEAVNALRHNAVHYLRKPFEIDELLATVNEVAERTLAQRVASGQQIAETDPSIASAVVGNTPAMVALKHRLSAIARADALALIHGETGTGRMLTARAIHLAGERSDGPFVSVNCGALPERLIESELFGHEEGAFTGAGQDRKHRLPVHQGGRRRRHDCQECGGGRCQGACRGNPRAANARKVTGGALQEGNVNAEEVR